MWLKLARRNAGAASVTYAEAVEAALCYGWIDGQTGPFDDAFWVQRFTRRGTRSKWSKVNRQRALRLIEEGRMKPAGLEAVEQARRNGSWDRAYDAPSTATVPADLKRELAKAPEAAALFAALSSRNRYALLYRIQDAKKPETRARRIQHFVAMLARNETPYPQPHGAASPPPAAARVRPPARGHSST